METLIDVTIESFTMIVTESWDAPHCESLHLAQNNATCSHTPVAIQVATCLNRSLVVCQAHMAWVAWVIQGKLNHNKCHRPWGECIFHLPYEG